jgi:hypothetical protein
MVLALAGVVVLIFVLGIAFMPKKQDLSQYDFLKEPRITAMPDQKMLVVTIRGDPDIAAKSAFGKLYGAQYRLKRVVSGIQDAAPRARWHGASSGPQSSWTGVFGLPVPEAADDRALSSVQADADVKVDTWTYGEVAEVLHIGSYDAETPDIDRLHAFIDNAGYEIAGDHEEEYLKGPTVFGRGNPAQYRTIIRYCVRKTGATGDSTTH